MPFHLIAYSAVTLAGIVGGVVAELTERPLLDIIHSMANNAEKENRFLSDLNRSDNTVQSYRYALQHFNAVVGDDAPLNIEAYIKFLKSLRDYSPSTQRLYRTAVHGFYDFCDAADERKLKEADRRYVRRQGERFPNPNMEAIEKFITYCEKLRGGLLDLRDRAFVLLLVDTGLRISEACALKRGDIDWTNERVVMIGKGDKQANVRLSTRSLRVIKDYLSARAKMDGESGKPLSSLPLFARHDRGAGGKVKPVEKNGMWFAIKGHVKPNGKWVRGRLDKAGIDRMAITVHDFRHYFVTAVMRSKGMKVAQELARHKSISITQRYAHLNDEELDRAYDEIFNRRSPTGEKE